jgi:hypothetical protein
MRNSEKVRRSTAPNLLVQYLLAELTLQLTVDPSKSQRLFPRADGRSQQEPTARADGRSQQKPTVDPSKNRQQEPTLFPTISTLQNHQPVKFISDTWYTGSSKTSKVNYIQQ